MGKVVVMVLVSEKLLQQIGEGEDAHTLVEVPVDAVWRPPDESTASPTGRNTPACAIARRERRRLGDGRDARSLGGACELRLPRGEVGSAGGEVARGRGAACVRGAGRRPGPAASGWRLAAAVGGLLDVGRVRGTPRAAGTARGPRAAGAGARGGRPGRRRGGPAPAPARGDDAGAVSVPPAVRRASAAGAEAGVGLRGRGPAGHGAVGRAADAGDRAVRAAGGVRARPGALVGLGELGHGVTQRRPGDAPARVVLGDERREDPGLLGRPAGRSHISGGCAHRQ